MSNHECSQLSKVTPGACVDARCFALQIKQFTQFPVVVSSYSNRITAHPEDVSAKLWVQHGAAGASDAVEGDTPVPGPPAEQLVPSAMAMETLFED